MLFEETLKIAFSFPTSIFTVFLGVMLVLWVVTLLGVLDLDFIDIESSLDTPTAEAVAGFLMNWGLRGVPITIMLTVLSVSCWIVCYYIVFFTFSYVPSGLLTYLAGTVTIIFSFLSSIKITAFLITPLKPLFKKVGKTIEKTILGKVVTIRSSKVTENFGEAIINDMGADLLLKVWASEPNTLSKGDKAVPIKHNPSNGAYLVVPEHEFKN